MKWLLIALSMLIKRFVHTEGPSINPIEEVKNLIKDNALKIFLVLSAAVAFGTLLTSGIVLTILGFSAQIDTGVKLRLTTILVSGICIIASCILLFALGISKSSAKNRRREKDKKGEQRDSMQEALMLLINDFIKERESKRAFQQEFSDNRRKQNNQTTEEINEFIPRSTRH